MRLQFEPQNFATLNRKRFSSSLIAVAARLPSCHLTPEPAKLRPATGPVRHEAAREGDNAEDGVNSERYFVSVTKLDTRIGAGLIFAAAAPSDYASLPKCDVKNTR